MWCTGGAGWGPGLTVTVVEGSHVPGSVWPAVVVVCGGWMTGRLVTGMGTRAWTGWCWVVASAVVVGAGGRGARVAVGGGFWLGRGSGQGWCRVVLCRCVCGVVCARVGAGLDLGSGLGLGSGSRLRSTSFRKCQGADVGLGVVPVRCRGVRVACVGVGGSVCAAPALAFAVALRMRAAGRGGSEDEVEEVDEAEDEEEVVDAGWAVMRAGLWAAASAAATAGRMEGMSSGCRLGAGGWGGPVVTWRPGGPIWSAAAGEGGAGLWPSPSGLGSARVLQCARSCGLVSAGGTVRLGCIQGPGGVGLGPLGCVRGAWVGHWVGWACRGALGSPRRVCVGCRVSGAVKGVRRTRVWRACAGVRAGGGGPCRGAPGVRAMVGVCGSPVEQREGRGMGGDCAVGCTVSVYVSACRGALAWAVVGRAVWRRSLPSSAAAARISQTSLRIWWTSWSVVGRGYASFGLRPARLRTLWMAWYPQVRDCCGLGGGVGSCVRACLDLCVGGGDGPNPGHGPRGWPAALDSVG